MIDTANNTAITNVPMSGHLAGIAMTPDGRRIYIADNGNNQLQVLNAGNSTRLTPVNVGISPVSMGQFMQPGAIFVSGFEPGAK